MIEPKKLEVTADLAQAIASAIAYSAGVALAAHDVPRASQIAAEVGNNCAQTVISLVEAFLEDWTVPSQLRRT